MRDLQADGYFVRREDLAQLSPYQTRRLKRFGDYTLSLGAPDPFETDLVVPFPIEETAQPAATAWDTSDHMLTTAGGKQNATRRKSFRGNASTSRRTMSTELRSA